MFYLQLVGLVFYILTFVSDTLKGSFYANPILDEPNTTPEQKLDFPEYYSRNVWPKEDSIEGFEEAFKSLGRYFIRCSRIASVILPGILDLSSKLDGN